ncbi:MAG: hypothetical protein Q4E46_01060 [Candidatus Saccharibacteria bacterium]|nr:hypothetical protein [Candidatus Saccharibacteria bacterium]
MKEGHDKAFTELPEFSDAKGEKKEVINTANANELDEGSRAKIEHDPHTRVKEEVKYSADDILDETVAGTQDEIIQNVKTPDPDFQAELQKTRETLKRNFLVRLFDREHKATTFSVLCAILAALVLLIVPTLIPKGYDPKAINPETGYSNEETEWLKFTDDVRGTVNSMSTPDAENPEEGILKYFDELLEDHKGIAEQIDIYIIRAEYYTNFGRHAEAVGQLTNIDVSDYKQPLVDDPDLGAYFERMFKYYTLVRDLYAALDEQAQVTEYNKLIDDLLNEKIRTYNAIHDAPIATPVDEDNQNNETEEK